VTKKISLWQAGKATKNTRCTQRTRRSQSW